jgi:hypothetical protein
MPEATYDLIENTQLTHDSLRVGMAGIAAEDFPDESGASQHGVRAGLWISYREDADLDCAVRVHAGQSLTVADYRIDVLAIRPGQPGVVKLRLTREPAPD